MFRSTLGTCSESSTGTARGETGEGRSGSGRVRSGSVARRRAAGRHDGPMPRPPAPHGRTGRPPVTSRAQILTAARRLIDRDGWEKLTIRRLAAEIGIGATTLYHHIRDKEDLLVQLLNHHVGLLERPALPDDPRDRVVAAATAMHDALAAWPWAAEVLTTDGFVGLLDESALWMVDAIVGGADDYGCTPAAVRRRLPQHLVLHGRRDPGPRPLRPPAGRREAARVPHRLRRLPGAAPGRHRRAMARAGLPGHLSRRAPHARRRPARPRRPRGPLPADAAVTARAPAAVGAGRNTARPPPERGPTVCLRSCVRPGRARVRTGLRPYGGVGGGQPTAFQWS